MRGIIVFIIGVLLFAIISLMLWLRERRTVTRVCARMDEFWAVKERRKFIRLPTKLNVSCKILEKANGIWQTFSKDISGEGICITANEILSKDSLVELTINLPGKNKSLVARGEVVWVKEVQQDKPDAKRLFNTGIRFTRVDAQSKKDLLEYINANLSKAA